MLIVLSKHSGKPAAQVGSFSRRMLHLCAPLMFMWNLHFCWQGAKEIKPRSRMQGTGVEEYGLMGGRNSGKLQVAIWKFSGKENGCACLLQSLTQPRNSCCCLCWSCTLRSQLFSLPDDDLTCHVIILIFISLPSFPTPCLELTPWSPHMSPGEFPAVTVGDCDCKGELARGFHKSVIQPEFWDIFIFSIIYSGHGI